MVEKKKSIPLGLTIILGMIGLFIGNLIVSEYNALQEMQKEKQDQDKINQAIQARDMGLCGQPMNHQYNQVSCVKSLVERTEPPECNKLSDGNLVYACNTFNALKHGDDSICENMGKCSIDRDSCYAQFCTRGYKTSCEKICSPALREMVENNQGSNVINLGS